jgi:hypothetical protein
VQAKGMPNIFNKIITENFPNLEKLCLFSYRKPPEHQTDLIKIELPQDILSFKDKHRTRERILKVVREKKIIYKNKPLKITSDFSEESLKARRAWSEVFRTLKENNFKPRIFYSAKLSFKIHGAIKVFHDKQKLKQYITNKPPPQKILQGILHTESGSKETMKGQAI